MESSSEGIQCTNHLFDSPPSLWGLLLKLKEPSSTGQRRLPTLQGIVYSISAGGPGLRVKVDKPMIVSET